MTVRTPPNNLQNATTHTAAGDRALIYSQFGGREGVTGQNDLLVKQNGTPNMSILVSAGRCVVFGDSNADQQLYHMWNDADVNLVISAADPTNARRDLIVAEVRDTLYGGAADDWRLRVVTGTPSGSPADPATPSNAIVLARVAVAAAATSITNANITDLRPKAGSIAVSDIICTSTTRPSNPFVGMRIYETDTARQLVYAGATSGWNPPWNIGWGYMGAANVSISNQAMSAAYADITSATVTFTRVAGRRYAIRYKAGAYFTGSAGTCGIALADSANSVLDISNIQMSDNGNVAFASGFHVYDASAAGTFTVKLRGIVVTGTSVSVYGGGGGNPRILVEDIGPSANPT